jgi:RNA polymerase sigma factor (sigma-70 family)
MDSRHSPGFALTHWSVIQAAQGSDAAAARTALGRIYEMYSYPLYAFLRRRGCSPDEAQDLLQSFFVRMMEKEFLQAVDPQRGRFRTFLLTALKHFVINEAARDKAQKRGGGQLHLSLDQAEAESRYRTEPRYAVTPEALYERRWALALLQQVEERLTHEWLAAEKQALLRFLLPTLTRDAHSVPYAEIARQTGTTLSAVQNAARRLRQRFGELLRQELAAHVADPRDVEDEVSSLLEILAR